MSGRSRRTEKRAGPNLYVHNRLGCSVLNYHMLAAAFSWLPHTLDCSVPSPSSRDANAEEWVLLGSESDEAGIDAEDEQAIRAPRTTLLTAMTPAPRPGARWQWLRQRRASANLRPRGPPRHAAVQRRDTRHEQRRGR